MKDYINKKCYFYERAIITQYHRNSIFVVRLAGVEPAHPKALPPEDSASAIPPQPHEICTYCITFDVSCQINVLLKHIMLS